MTERVKKIVAELEEQLFQDFINKDITLEEVDEFLESQVLEDEEYEIACAFRNVSNRIKNL